MFGGLHGGSRYICCPVAQLLLLTAHSVLVYGRTADGGLSSAGDELGRRQVFGHLSSSRLYLSCQPAELHLHIPSEEYSLSTGVYVHLLVTAC